MLLSKSLDAQIRNALKRKNSWEDATPQTNDAELAKARMAEPPLNKMDHPTLKAAILVISTTASKDSSTDSSGVILENVILEEGGGKWEVVETKIVGDDVLDIQKAVMRWTDGEPNVNAIITTGGTGFAVHDITPEVGEV